MIEKLSNGITIVVNNIPSMYSVAMGIYVGIGSAYEDETQSGISHLVEHMMFKGTPKYSPYQIADLFDKLGSQSNAFTSKEITCYYAKSTTFNAEKSFDLLAEIFCNSTFDEIELSREKDVVIKEIAMYEDNAEEVCNDLLAKEFFLGGRLGRNIVGTEEIVKHISRQDLFNYVNTHYTTDNIVLVFAGNIDMSTAKSWANKYFASREISHITKPSICSAKRGKFVYKAKDVELANICIGYPSVKFDDKYINHYTLLNTIFGGGMSSRLFQEIREKRGLAYSVYSYISAFVDCGMNTLYIGCDPNKVEEALTVTERVCQEFCQNGITADEFEKGIATMESALIFGQESSTSIMNALGKYALMTGKEFSIEQKLNEIKSISFDEINHLAKNMFEANQKVVAFVGKKQYCDKIEKLF